MVETAMQRRFERMTILVTGGTGSFGRAMVERLLARDCGEIRVLSREKLGHLLRKRPDFFLGRASYDWDTDMNSFRSGSLGKRGHFQ